MDKEQISIERIKMASEMSLRYYGQPIICTYSGGKDSDVMLELFKRSGVPFEVHNSHTTVDAPETVYHIRKRFKELELKGIKCTIQKPKMTMWQLIPHKKMPPTQLARYCCQELKESSCHNRMIATGVRWDESTQRRTRGTLEYIAPKKSDKITLMNDNDDKRMIIEKCNLQAKTVCNPIIDWNHHDIWNYINSEHLQVNELYYCGFSRVGCIGCPMANKHRYFEFARYPKYKNAYLRSFKKMLEVLWNDGAKTKWKNEYDVFEWWMRSDKIPGQLEFEINTGKLEFEINKQELPFYVAN